MNSLIHSWMNMDTVKGWGILEFFLDPAIRFELPISCHWSLLILPENIRKPEVSQKRSKAWNGLKSSIVGYIHKIKNQEIYRDLLLSEKEQNFEGYSFTALLKWAKIEDYIDHIRSETIFGNWKPFKNAFYFTLKALFVLKILEFLP